MHDEPFEAGILAIELVQRRHCPVKPVEITHESLNTGRGWVLEKMPIERMVMPPLALLTELAAHEQELLARMTEHEPVIGAQIGKALPLIARHAAENRTLTVHDFVVGQRQDEVFEEGVMQTENDLAVMILAVDRILADVFKHLLHPSHIPLLTTSETTPLHFTQPHCPRTRH